MDKFYHFIACFAIVLVSGLCGLPVWAAVLLGCAAGVGKEAYDLFHPDKHTADWEDLMWDGFGILAALFFAL